ncbi:MAG: hypothetical protein PQJ46_06585 [Spirochaetales bacterium]|nr:hypothetical protein [Spirochaetales bacterium]
MSYSATIYRVLIASPGDVEKERNQISNVISDWNCINSENSKIALLPVRWETHAKPGAGRAQELINDQLVKNSDILIGVFWKRIGSPTGAHASGTIEEIEEFLKEKKPVLLYFSKKAIPSDCDLDQLKMLRDFKESMKERCLFFEYEDIIELKDHLNRHISLQINDMPNVENKIDVGDSPKPRPKMKTINEGIYFEDYEKNGRVRSFIVKGDTRNIKEELKKCGGKWNNTLGGWIFPKLKEEETRKALKEFL